MKFKRPTVVHWMAIGLILAPIGNFLLSGALLFPLDFRSQAAGWAWVIDRSSPVFWFVSFLEVLAGILLFLRRKLAWTFSVSLLLALTAFNLFFLFSGSLYPFVIILFSVFFTAAAWLIALHMKYPYLDRRDHLFWVAHRYACRFEVDLLSSGKKLAGAVRDISVSGAKVETKGNLRPGEKIQVRVSVLMDAEVVRKGTDDFGLKFHFKNGNERSVIKSIISKVRKK